jgi:hypothetical protein
MPHCILVLRSFYLTITQGFKRIAHGTVLVGQVSSKLQREHQGRFHPMACLQPRHPADVVLPKSTQAFCMFRLAGWSKGEIYEED